MSLLAWKDSLELEDVHLGPILELHLKSLRQRAFCPTCHQESHYAHSCYRRSIADLPWAGNPLKISLLVHRFRCRNSSCPHKIFSERLETAPTYSRRTSRMQHQLAQIAFQLGGQAGARLATLLGMPVSDTTLVRMLRATEDPPFPCPKALGVDDWSLKKGRAYGTILVDLDKQQAIDLLPDREAATLAQWLRQHPHVEVISRDRATCYAEGAKQGAPQAIQIADRWHLLKNLGEALKRMLDKHLPELRLAAKQLAVQRQQKDKEAMHPVTVTGTCVSLASPTAQRALLFQEVKKLSEEGLSNRAIGRRLGISRNTVNRYGHWDHYPGKSRAKEQQSTVLPFKAYLAQRWQEGEQLWREIQQQGFAGSVGSVYRFFEKLPKETETIPLPELEVKNWTTTKVQFLLTKQETELAVEEQDFLKTFFQYCPQAEIARALALNFKSILEKKQASALSAWIQQAKCCGIKALKNFAAGLVSDYQAVEAAATYKWSNGQVEGQVNRLKMIKRQMYGRAGFDLLRKRVIFSMNSF